MKNKKTKIIIGIVVGIILVFLGITFSLVSMMNKEHKKTEQKQNEIKSEYQGFKEAADKFTTARKKYQTVVENDMYIESVVEDYEDWVEAIKEYQDVVDNVIENTKSLDKLCIGKNYPDQNIMASCEAYMINYETVMNYFVKDIESFNEFMENYHNTNPENKEKYPTYELKENYHYIDINDDGKFIGKD